MHEENVASENLSIEKREQLIEIVRHEVDSAANNSRIENYESDDPDMNRKSGVFVTLYDSAKQLRGCIGYIESDKPLINTISRAARAAAMSDPRFSPVTPEEVDDLVVDISILSPMEVIKDIEKIEVGVHGLLISRGSYRGLLLPQVATKYKWDRERFLDEACIKAGLSENDWRKQSVEIKIFSAEVFGEDDI
jgi:AmmeMemoRadiSam system protein A